MQQDVDYATRAEAVGLRAQEATTRRLLEDDATGGFGDLAGAGCASGTWIHVPARGALRIAILSKRAYRYQGHWWAGAMHNCPPERCQYCARGIGIQVKIVLSVHDLDAGGAGLLELTPTTAAVIAAQYTEAGFLRGLTFKLKHAEGRSNGRIVIEPTGPVLSMATLPDAANVSAAMQAQWAARGEL